MPKYVPTIRIGNDDYIVKDSEARTAIEGIKKCSDYDGTVFKGTNEYTSIIDLGRKGDWSLNRIDDETGADVNNGTLSRTDNYIEIEYPNFPIWYKIHASGRPLAICVYLYNSIKQYLGMYETYFHPEEAMNQMWLYEKYPTFKYIRLTVWEQNRNKFDSLNDVLPYIDIWQDENNFDIHDFDFVKGISCTCEDDCSGYATYAEDKYAMSKYYPVGKGTRFQSRELDVEEHPEYYGYRFVCYYTFDEHFNCTGYSIDRNDYWVGNFTATEDCYIRLVVRGRRETAMTDADLEFTLNRICVHYVPPTNTNFTKLDSVSQKPAKAFLTPGFSLWSKSEPRNEAEFVNNQRVLSEYLPAGKGTYFRMDTTKEEETDQTRKLIVFEYDKNFVYKRESTDWEVDYVMHQDGYVRLILRRANMDLDVSTDIDFIYNCLHVDYIAPKDPDLSEPLKTRIHRSIDVTTDMLFRERISEVGGEYLKLSEPNQLGYAWISDIHLDTRMNRQYYVRFIIKRMMNALRKVSDKAGLDFVCIGGDVIDAEDSKNNVFDLMEDLREMLDGFQVPVIWLFGNHDNNVYGRFNEGEGHPYRFTEELPMTQACALFASKSEFHNGIQMGDVNEGYFYFDIPAKKKRIVCLNGNAPEGSAHTDSWWCVNQAEVEWLCETAMDTPYDIVILSHTPPGTKYEFYGHGNNNGYYTDFGNAIAAYNARQTITLYGTAYDFTNAEGTVKYIHCGHTHFDLDPEVEPFTWGGVPVVVTSCAKQWGQTLREDEATEVTPGTDLYYYTQEQAAASHANEYGWKFYLWTDRKWETYNEALFDVVSMNSDNVHTFRIGAGHDRDYDLS